MPRLPGRILSAAAALLLGSIGVSTFAATGAGPDAYGYTSAAIAVNFEDLSIAGNGATTILSNAEDDAVTIPLPFPFLFYGTYYNSISISSNGLLTFGGTDTSKGPADFTKAGPTANLPSIAPFWHDWTFVYLGSDAVYYQILGSIGSRRLVVHWSAALSLPGPGRDTVNFEAKLFEGSNNIEFHYDDATIVDDSTNSNGLNTTVGIRNTNGQTTGLNLLLSYDQAVVNDDTAKKITAPVFKITSITRPSTHHVVLQCKGAPSITNKIEVSPDQSANSWTVLTSVLADSSGSFSFDDGSATTLSATKRFYRVAIPK